MKMLPRMTLVFSALVLTVSILSAAGRAAEIDESPLAIRATQAFIDLEFRRPIVMTYAGDGSDRLFVAEQEGVIRVFKNDQDATESSPFLDIESKVVYKDNENEEGLLGFAFHPKYKENGHLFVYYTTTDAPHTSVVSRFTVSADNPQHVDPKTEVEILRIPQPFWNHNGGTIAFGPDGYLYIALGDGGAGNDPMGNGQNLKTWLGSILRIDVDHKSDGKNYSIPKDNPFVKTPGARPEIYAYGVRNIWRLSFDRKTGLCWAADVGQNIWEEIDIIVKGGNYGWNLREAKHKFGPNGVGPRKDLIDPIWEYHHDIGKSITGGQVYRGKQFPELEGSYLYADYVSGRIWALKYDADKKVVTANRSISWPEGVDPLPVMSFGEDEQGEAYMLTPSGHIFGFEKAE